MKSTVAFVFRGVRRSVFAGFLIALVHCSLPAQTPSVPELPAGYETNKAAAEAFYAEGSFARAHEIYSRIDLSSGMPETEVRWVRFRLADTSWRSQAATATADTTRFDEARRQLEDLVDNVESEEGRDRVWAEAHESLGDFYWTRLNSQQWPEAFEHYKPALEWWAGAIDIELARKRYLAMVWRMARPPHVQPYTRYGNWGNYVPLNILENALKIARTTNDVTHAHYLIALTLQNQGGDWEQRARVPEEFEAAIAAGKSADWYDDALFQYAEWMAGQGRIVPLANGQRTYQPDYAKALELYRRLIREFNRGETRYYESAEQNIRQIVEPQLNVSVGFTFVPDSEIQYHLSWRNVGQIDLAIYSVDLNRDVQLSTDESHPQWLQSIDLGRAERVRSWTRETRDTGQHIPASENVRLDEKLPPGAYVIQASAGGKQARDLILVTDAALVLKTSGRQALVYFCNALDSSPIPGATVKVSERWHQFNRWHAREQTKTVNSNGIAVFDLQGSSGAEVLATAVIEQRQAFSHNHVYDRDGNRGAWKIYAFTDRPAYRPAETAQWKFIARQFNGSVYSTPSRQTVEYDVNDPRGAKVSSGKATLNEFGSSSGSLELTAQMPLGEYVITFWNEGRERQIGRATLFRLEEYKLPEFKVSVQTPEETGPDKVSRPKAFRLGESVDVTIQADYYFGGPVANATVEVVVHQNPFWRLWPQPREYPWYYQEGNSAYHRRPWMQGGNSGPIITRETLKTDATGKATLTFDTPRGGGQDFEYHIEARVTDSSRREIVGTGKVRVTQQRYYVNARADHNLFRAQDRVNVNFTALDANDRPVETEGTVRVTREYWFEIWSAPDGREVKGDELKRLQSQTRIWPPLPERPDQRNWVLKFRGYERDDIITRSVKTGTNGLAEFTFTPDRDGYYKIAWESSDAIAAARGQAANPIRAETTVWVANNATTDLGYRSSGIEIIADRDTFRVGQRAPVMLVTDSADSYVLFAVEGRDLLSYQLVHMTGTVKLIELPVEEQHVPNVFLNAVLVRDRSVFMDSEEIIVPPTKNFLTVDVASDRPQYQPQEDGTFIITAKDDQGRPASTEIAFSLVDESVFYIQNDYAGDPRQFFFGDKRPHTVGTVSTMNRKNYVKLVPWRDGQVVDERVRAGIELRERSRSDSFFSGYDDIGGAGGGGEMLADGSREYFKRSARTMSIAVRGEGAVSQALDPMTGAPFDAAAVAERPGAPGEQSPDEPVQVRSDFRSTILWQPSVMTGADGRATIRVRYPDSLTGWKATARAVSTGNQFGIGETSTRTKQPLIVRLQAPRFFVVGDFVTLSAVINNNTDEPMDVRLTLETSGLAATTTNAARVPILGNIAILSGGRLRDGAPVMTVSANGEARVDWTARVENAGEVKLKVTGRAGKFSDAMEKTYTSHEHGIEKFIAKSGKAAGGDVTIRLDLPSERKAGSTSMSVQFTPSLAVTMLDALPYLVNYPYGCTEQTMSRFLPAAITAKTLRDLQLEPADVMGRVFGGIETNFASATQPKGKRNLDELDAMVKAGLERLYDFQHSDGGWGWWKDGNTDHWMTAYVVWGLSLARDAGISVRENALSRGCDYLEQELVEEEENPDMQAWMLHAVAVCREKDGPASAFALKAFENLWSKRDQLNAYTTALLTLSANEFGDVEKARTLARNLENGVKRDDRPDISVLINTRAPRETNDVVQGTAHWGEDGIYWRWSEGGVEATAFALRALLAVDPENKLIEPVTNWLIKNRRGAQWSNTRDTAITVLTMNDYLKASGELQVNGDYEIFVNGRSIGRKRVAGTEVFNAPSRFSIESGLVRDENEIRIVNRGSGPVYFAVEAKFFSLEEPVTPAGNEIFVRREYFRLAGRPTLLKGYVYDRVPLRDGDNVKSGERVETVLTIEGKNNYEYLVFEDLKPAGLEAVAVRSGESLFAKELKAGAVERKFASTAAPAGGSSNTASETDFVGSRSPQRPGPMILPRPEEPVDSDFTGRSRWVHQELRDRKVGLFIDKLPEGVWQVRYEMRAEVPGRFHALPVSGHAMYVPEIRCNGAEIRISVAD